ncbi:hypothetical protein DL767_008153 [Monosporascus sp. MG133]|nr:hypothetical protein DL767_008153 [Monosporascus sp. MG133]
MVAQQMKTWGQIKGKLGLNTTAKPLPEPAYEVRKAAGKEKAVESLAARRAAVGAADGLGNLQDDSDEEEAGPPRPKGSRRRRRRMRTSRLRWRRRRRRKRGEGDEK